MSEHEDMTKMTREDLERIKDAERQKPGFTGEYSDFVKRAEKAVERNEAAARNKNN